MKTWRITALILSHTTLTTLASAGFKLSAASNGWRSFWLWQIAGNLAGFGGVLVLTALLRLTPIYFAYPVTQGLAVIGVQVITARLLFREAIGLSQWMGTGLVVIGIMLISSRP